jgi:hypothetical protein
MTNRSPHRDALRVLFILVKGSTPLTVDDSSGAAGIFTGIFKGEARLYALDFWMKSGLLGR